MAFITGTIISHLVIGGDDINLSVIKGNDPIADEYLNFDSVSWNVTLVQKVTSNTPDTMTLSLFCSYQVSGTIQSVQTCIISLCLFIRF